MCPEKWANIESPNNKNENTILKNAQGTIDFINMKGNKTVDIINFIGNKIFNKHDREKYMDVAWRFVKQYPLTGIGLANFAVKSGFGVYCHCDYLEVLCGYGIIG